MSALSRMACNDHRKVSVTADDFIIISATPIPGNEKTVSRVVNDLMRLGAEVTQDNTSHITDTQSIHKNPAGRDHFLVFHRHAVQLKDPAIFADQHMIVVHPHRQREAGQEGL